MPHAPARALLAVLLPTAIVLAGCGSDRQTTTATSGSTPITPATPDAAASPPGSTPTTSAGPSTDEAFNIAYDGATSGDTGRLPIPLGDSVTITVTSSVADEVHLHGYDVTAPVSPGAPAVLTFDATIPGVFEVELEGLGVQLAAVQVQ